MKKTKKRKLMRRYHVTIEIRTTKTGVKDLIEKTLKTVFKNIARLHVSIRHGGTDEDFEV